MTQYLIIPGLGDSGPDHWQTHIEKSGDNFHRVNQKEWDRPTCSDWTSALDAALTPYDLQDVVLVGHSLGCATIVHWANRYKKIIKGAFMVAPSDPEAEHYTFPATGFDPVPLEKLRFPSHVIASENDPWVTFERAKYFSGRWGSTFTNLGQAGHINVASGHGAWPTGLEMLKKLA